MSKADIQFLHMQNNAYRDFIANFKKQINEYDQLIRANEREIGLQLEEMARDSGVSTEAMEAYDCTLCLGECHNVHD